MVIALAAPVSVFADDTTTSFAAVADAYVSQSQPSRQFGLTTELRVAPR
jgi:hypothetical protein